MVVLRQRRKRSSVGTSERHLILRGCDGLHGGMHPTVVSCSFEHSTSRATLVSGGAWRVRRVQGSAAGEGRARAAGQQAGGAGAEGQHPGVQELRGSIRGVQKLKGRIGVGSGAEGQHPGVLPCAPRRRGRGQRDGLRLPIGQRRPRPGAAVRRREARLLLRPRVRALRLPGPPPLISEPRATLIDVGKELRWRWLASVEWCGVGGVFIGAEDVASQPLPSPPPPSFPACVSSCMDPRATFPRLLSHTGLGGAGGPSV